MSDFLGLLDHSSIGEEFHHFYLECFIFYHDYRLDRTSLSFHDFIILCLERYFSEEFDFEFRKLLREDDSDEHIGGYHETDNK